MKHTKNTDTLLFLLLFNTGQREKNIEIKFAMNAVAHKS